MTIFFCAGMSSEMAEPKINVEDPRLDSSTDGDDDGPDARQRRRERREAKKNLMADESVLDESDEESETSRMEQEESDAAQPVPPPVMTSGGETAPQLLQETETTADPGTAAAAEAVAAAEAKAAATAAAAADGAAAQAPVQLPAASMKAADTEQGRNSGPDSGISIGDLTPDKIKALFSKKPIETIMLNINTEANQTGAEVQLSPNPANRSGAGGGGSLTLAVVTPLRDNPRPLTVRTVRFQL
jgi:hypothetical protein